MYRTIPVKARFKDEEQAFWVYQCYQANSLINCAIYYTRQNHYAFLEQKENAFAIYWRDDELRHSWKTYRCRTTYPEPDKALKDNSHYKAMAAQSAQQTLKTVGESINSYNSLVKSKFSYLDSDSLYEYGEKPNGCQPSGHRVKRGLYKTSQGFLVNADCNGAANILGFVATQLELNLAEVGRGALTLPKRYDLFGSLTKSYRKRCVACLKTA